MCSSSGGQKIVLYSLWYHHTETSEWSKITKIIILVILDLSLVQCDDTRDCIIQFCPPDDEQMCSKHLEA